jgi:hypothetical protein
VNAGLAISDFRIAVVVLARLGFTAPGPVDMLPARCRRPVFICARRLLLEQEVRMRFQLASSRLVSKPRITCHLPNRGALALLLVAATAALPTRAEAADFRIVSEVIYEKAVVSTNRTLFRAGVVYDYLKAPGLTTVFDPARQRFILLDPTTKLRCEVDKVQVAQFNNALRERAAENADPLLKFMAKPVFNIEPNQPQGRLKLTSPLITYQLKTTPVEDRESLRQYIEFCDWYAQLNTMVNPGSPPPFARMKVNQELRTRLEMPLEVQLTISVRQPRGGNRQVELQSRHEVAWRLLGEDTVLIEQTAEEMAIFKEVSFEEFQQRGNALAGAPPAPGEGEDADVAPVPTSGNDSGVRKASATEARKKPATKRK